LFVAGIDLDDLVESGLDPVGAGEAQSPQETTTRGAGTASRVFRSRTTMFLVTTPVTRSPSARRGDEARPDARRVVDRSEGRGDLELAAVARPDVDVTELERSWEERRWRRSWGRGDGLGDGAREQRPEDGEPSHD
jgi:hypothetical protein